MKSSRFLWAWALVLVGVWAVPDFMSTFWGTSGAIVVIAYALLLDTGEFPTTPPAK